jgi:carbamoyltransferase
MLNVIAKLMFGEHHQSHAFYPSPYEKAAVLTIDGEWSTTSLALGEKNFLQELHSLGLLYLLGLK